MEGGFTSHHPKKRGKMTVFSVGGPHAAAQFRSHCGLVLLYKSLTPLRTVLTVRILTSPNSAHR